MATSAYRAAQPNTVKSRITITRPNNATQYAARDVVGDTGATSYVFENVVRYKGDAGNIQALRGTTTSGEAVHLAGDVFLFTQDLVRIADNSAFVSNASDLPNFAGVISFASSDSYIGKAATDGNYVFEVNDLDLPFVCASDSRDLYAVLVATNTYTPKPLEVIRLDAYVCRANA